MFLFLIYIYILTILILMFSGGAVRAFCVRWRFFSRVAQFQRKHEGARERNGFWPLLSAGEPVFPDTTRRLFEGMGGMGDRWV